MAIERASLVLESLSALNEAVQDTLETLTYKEALPVDAASIASLRAPYYITTVAVNRPYTGVIRLKIGRDLAIGLVGSMLGSPQPIEEAWVHDGLSELVNTIGGRILAHLVDAYSSFDLGIPETLFVEKEAGPAEGVLIRQIYAVDESSIELELEFKKARAA
ncbi:MAG TPA: chemotaxis protein CheX [Oligoflexus sp.]|uniref:chemotaxis protein CheX n=1 Tax=Oligoflexus sp. TaxID=1971216 RepID=UPI002D803132|nr:chemotaxis protein CheX [Oligoflexus sp.]HET9238614.1 chemotaxis protein CheX [Oligoflexus sp.]